MIQADHLTKSYGPVTAVHDVSFNVDKGRAEKLYLVVMRLDGQAVAARPRESR